MIKVNNLEIVQFSRATLEDFKDFILPNIYEQLFLLDDFTEEAIIAVGAVIDNIPAGAAIIQTREDSEIYLYSIVVAQEYRRMGVGSEMIKNVLAIGNDMFEEYIVEGGNIVELFLHTEYALPGDELKAFEGFLKSVGFRDFYDRPSVCTFTENDVKGLGERSMEVMCLSEISGADERDIYEYFSGMGITPAVKYSFFSGTEDKPRCMFLVQYDDDDAFVISSVAVEEDVTKDEYEKLFYSALDAIKKDNEQYTLIVNIEMNIMADYWEKLAKNSGEISTHREAGLYAEFR